MGGGGEVALRLTIVLLNIFEPAHLTLVLITRA